MIFFLKEKQINRAFFILFTLLIHVIPQELMLKTVYNRQLVNDF
jgi:hypothetical protein